MPHFPMFVNLEGQNVTVIGGGKVALRKIEKLSPFGAHIQVIAPVIASQIRTIPNLKLHQRKFRFWDLFPRPALVIAATDQKALNRKIARFCRGHHIPVNVADDPAYCSFLFPALVQRGSFTAGISTDGASPVAAAYYKDQLQQMLPNHLEEILLWLQEQRPMLKAQIPRQCQRAAVFQKLFDACITADRPLTAEEACAYWDPSKPTPGSVALVGAGCGKADLITLRGLRLLQQCQAVVYDDLIDPRLLDAVPESAQRIYVGKRAGAHASPQEEINQILVDLSKSGLRVVRLKGGDPYLFGRGGEEMLALKENGISCQEVPGIPSPIGIPAEAGIPVTHRGISRSLHIITAHTSDTSDGLPADFDALAQLSGTLVFLMGLQQLPRITARLLAAGKSGDTPAAVLSGGNAPHPAQVRASLATLEDAVKSAHVEAPAIIVIGDVTAMDLDS